MTKISSKKMLRETAQQQKLNSLEERHDFELYDESDHQGFSCISPAASIPCVVTLVKAMSSELSHDRHGADDLWGHRGGGTQYL